MNGGHLTALPSATDFSQAAGFAHAAILETAAKWLPLVTMRAPSTQTLRAYTLPLCLEMSLFWGSSSPPPHMILLYNTIKDVCDRTISLKVI